MKGLRITLLSIALSSAAGSALAQQEPAQPVAEPAAAQPAEPAAEPAAAEPSAAEPAQPESRFRWGISGAGGPLVGGYSGGAGGLDARFGLQLDSLLAIYGQPVLLVGAGAKADLEGASATGLAMYGVGALADVTLANLFYAAAGPELLFGAIGEAEASATSAGASASASGATGPFFSIALRTGLALGSVEPNRRQAFTVGLDMHVVLANEAAILPMLALGYESY